MYLTAGGPQTVGGKGQPDGRSMSWGVAIPPAGPLRDLLPLRPHTAKGARGACLLPARLPRHHFFSWSASPLPWQRLQMLLSDGRPCGASRSPQPLYTHSGARPCGMQVFSCVWQSSAAPLHPHPPNISGHALVWPWHVHVGLCARRLLRRLHVRLGTAPTQCSVHWREGLAHTRAQAPLPVLHGRVLSKHSLLGS